MKKIAVLATALTIALSSAAFAQATGAGTTGQGAGNASGDQHSPGSAQSNNPTGNQERR
jgi:opacity protein-like surface antigen